MLMQIRQFGIHLALGIFLWTTGILIGGEYLHHEVHHCEDHEEEEDCSWQWLLLESFVSKRSEYLLQIPQMTFLRVTGEFQFLPSSLHSLPATRAPPHFS